MEDDLRAIRDLLIAKRAIEIGAQVLDTDAAEDIEEVGEPDSSGQRRRRLKFEAALREAVKEHQRASEVIAKLLQ